MSKQTSFGNKRNYRIHFLNTEIISPNNLLNLLKDHYTGCKYKRLLISTSGN